MRTMYLGSGKGDEKATAFRSLVQLLLSATIMHPDEYVRLHVRDQKAARFVLGGRDRTNTPIRLTNGMYLRLVMGLLIDEKHKGYLKVAKSDFQYQKTADPSEKSWVFRYDYERNRKDEHPIGHLHINGNLSRCEFLPKDKMLDRVHFPTARVSLEAVIRLLVNEFGVQCNEDENVWRSLLKTTEEQFWKYAHRC